MITQWVLLAVGLLLIAGTAFYVSAEFSLVTVDRSTVARQAGEGDKQAASLLTGLRHLSTQLSGAQIGITVTTLALGFVMEPSLADLLNGPLQGIGLGHDAAQTVGSIIALVLATGLSMVFGELVAKNIAIAEPLETAKSVIGPLRVSTWLFRPLIWVLNGVANTVLRVVGIEPQEELRAGRSLEELGSLVQRSAAQGTLEDSTAGLVSRSISFADKTADDVLTPRVRVRFVKSTDTADAVIAAAIDTGHSRFPVSGDDSDDVVGLVHLKHAVAVPIAERGRVPIRDLMTDVPLVPGTTPLDELLELLRNTGLQLAVVADEYGGTAGILTLEDVVEELVGEIADEHDPKAYRATRQWDRSWVFPGTLRPDEIGEITGVFLPESNAYETVAGLIIEKLGRLAQSADSIEVAAVMNANSSLGARQDFPDDQPIPAIPDEDVPRPVAVRLSVLHLVRRRIDVVQLSAVADQSDEVRGEGR